MTPHRFSLLIPALLLLALAFPSRADEPAAGWYVVRTGDFLARIAGRTGSTVPALRAANGLRGDLIHPDQKLVVPRPFARTAGPDIAWRPPCEGGGEVLRPYGEERRGELSLRRTGTDLARPLGSPIVAPADGVARYVGSQDGYGVLVILDHGAGYATVLGPLAPDDLLVATDQVVLAGDMLGRVDEPPDGPRPYVHVELRRHGHAVAPDRLLP